MVKARSDYKKVLRNSRMEYRKLQTQQLEMHRYDNAKSYWKLLKQACSTNSLKTILIKILKILLIILRPLTILIAGFFNQMKTFYISIKGI